MTDDTLMTLLEDLKALQREWLVIDDYRHNPSDDQDYHHGYTSGKEICADELGDVINKFTVELSSLY